LPFPQSVSSQKLLRFLRPFLLFSFVLSSGAIALGEASLFYFDYARLDVRFLEDEEAALVRVQGVRRVEPFCFPFRFTFPLLARGALGALSGTLFFFY